MHSASHQAGESLAKLRNIATPNVSKQRKKHLFPVCIMEVFDMLITLKNWANLIQQLP